MLSNFLSSDPAIEVVGSAANGEIGLLKISVLHPDVVILDIEMPVMDGLQVLAELRKSNQTLPVIMFSTLTNRGAVATLDALALGASDYATKSTEGVDALEHVCADLIPKIKALCPNRVPPPAASTRLPASATSGPSRARAEVHGPVEILTIGASTGGPNALARLICGLAGRLPFPVVIVQHMPQIFTRLLAERLAALSGYDVAEAKAGELLKAGEVRIAPGGLHMDLIKSSDGMRIRTHKGPPENSCRPAVDVLFRSVAQIYGPRSLAVVLTGMGQDGLLGCGLIREAGGRVLVQDEGSSVVWGMPGAVANAGLADKILTLPDLSSEINRLATRHRVPPVKTSINPNLISDPIPQSI